MMTMAITTQIVSAFVVQPKHQAATEVVARSSLLHMRHPVQSRRQSLQMLIEHTDVNHVEVAKQGAIAVNVLFDIATAYLLVRNRNNTL